MHRKKHQRLQSTFPWGTVDCAANDAAPKLNDQFFFLKRPLPLPASFLVDGSCLATLYKGAVEVEQLLADAKRVPGDYAERSWAAACLPGRPLDHPRVLEVAHRDELETRYRVAAWLAESNRLEESLQCFEELAQADPNWALPLRHLAKLHLTAGRLEQARQSAEAAYELEPDNAVILNTLGLVRSGQQDQVAAERFLRQATEHDPEFSEAFNNLGTILCCKTASVCARRVCPRRGTRFQLCPSPHESWQCTRGAQPNPVQQYEAVVRIDPTYVDAYNNLGTMHARLGNYRQAIQYYQEVIRLDPKHPDADRNLRLAVKLMNQRP